jgi:hypothetical protein
MGVEFSHLNTSAAQLVIEGEYYTREPSGCFSCFVARHSEPGDPIFIRGRICCFGDSVAVSELSNVPRHGLLCIPSSVELIQSDATGLLPFDWWSPLRVAFELHSRLLHINLDSFRHVRLLSLCVPASVVKFEGTAFDSSLQVLMFEAAPDEDLPERFPDLIGHPIYSVGAGNPHFAVVGHSLMDFEETVLIDYRDADVDELELDSHLEELAPKCIYQHSLSKVSFAENSRLRLIGRDVFAHCPHLATVSIPASVEVIGEGAFAWCGALVKVLFAAGSQLRLIEQDAFTHCDYLGPIDVPSRAAIRGNHTVVATVISETGEEHARVRFRSVRVGY